MRHSPFSGLAMGDVEITVAVECKLLADGGVDAFLVWRGLWLLDVM